jgi:hypothetical protein
MNIKYASDLLNLHEIFEREGSHPWRVCSLLCFEGLSLSLPAFSSHWKNFRKTSLGTWLGFRRIVGWLFSYNFPKQIILGISHLLLGGGPVNLGGGLPFLGPLLGRAKFFWAHLEGTVTNIWAPISVKKGIFQWPIKRALARCRTRIINGGFHAEKRQNLFHQHQSNFFHQR